MTDYYRFHRSHLHLTAPFGAGGYGQRAEAFARVFGTPGFLIGQTAIVAAWIAINVMGYVHFDKYPFILLNLAFSLQAAYAAPLILLAQTRQAERDKMWSSADAHHREELTQNNTTLLEQNTEMLKQNTDLTEQIAQLSRQLKQLTDEIHARIVTRG